MGQWNKRIFLVFFLLIATLFLAAHEFWLQPEKFIYKRGETINIRFKVGEHFNGDNWLGSAVRIKSLRLYINDAKDDLSEYLSHEQGDSLQLAMFDEGTAMITFNSTNTYIEMDAANFNRYLKEDRLDEAIRYRELNNETNDRGRELYQRSVKTIVQVGKKMNNCFRQNTQLPLDIIPQLNPYQLKNNQPLVAKIFFNRRPLVNAHVTVWQRLRDTTLERHLRTNLKGEVRFNVNTRGRWMLSTIKISRLLKNRKADWQSYWGSLTWGY